MHSPLFSRGTRHAARILLKTLAIILPTLLAAVAGAAEPRGELRCALSAKGYVTTWLLLGPLKLARTEQIDADDVLKAAGGEAKARPREGEVGDPATGRSWSLCVLPDNLADLKERCLPAGESGFYLAAVLVARKDFEGSLVLSHTGIARAWLDGEKVIESRRDPTARRAPSVAHKFSLKAGQRAHWLLKFASESRRLQFLVRLYRGEEPATAEDVAIALPLGGAAAGIAETHVLSALQLSAGGGELVEPGRKTEVLLGVVAGYPLCDGKIAATVAVKDSRGRAVGTLSLGPAPIAELAAKPAAAAWTPPKAGGSPYFSLVAQVTCEGRDLGALSKTLYSPRDIGRWIEELHQRLVSLTEQQKLDPDDSAAILLKMEKTALLLGTPGALEFSADEALGELKAGSEWLARLEKGQGLPPLDPGIHERAYLAEQDDSAQPYFLHIPRSYSPRKPAPAIVYLHGYAPWLDKTNWHELPYGLADLAEARGYVVIAPFARSNTDFQSIGEADVLQVLRLAQKSLAIDPDRVFLLGYSMGGSGAYTLAGHYPDLWAGCVALCGRPEQYLWRDFDRAKVEPFKRLLLDIESGRPHAPNFLHVPTLVFQGTADFLVSPERAYGFADELNGLGAKAKLVRLEGQTHWIADETFSTPTAFDWMDAQRRVAAPRTVRFKTLTLLYHRAYWLAIDAFERAGEPAEVEATLKPGNQLELAAKNVAQLTLRPPKSLCDPAAPFAATLNGKAAQLKADPQGELRVSLAPAKDTPLRKTPTLCGPIKDAFNRRFLFVTGTSGDDDATKANLKLAQRTQKEWYQFTKAFRPIVKDTAVADKEIARSNLILFGTPKTNALLARIAREGKLPIRFTDAGYEILGKTYKASDATGLIFIYPNPLAPERYVVVVCGAPYGEKAAPNHKYDLLPDFIVYSGEPDYDDTNAVYCAGFFDLAWQLDAKLTWTSDGQPQPRPEAPVKANP